MSELFHYPQPLAVSSPCNTSKAAAPSPLRAGYAPATLPQPTSAAPARPLGSTAAIAERHLRAHLQARCPEGCASGTGETNRCEAPNGCMAGLVPLSPDHGCLRVFLLRFMTDNPN